MVTTALTHKILIVDDQAGMRRSLSILLKKAGFLAEEAENGEQAIELLAKDHFDAVIADLKMSPGTGLDLLLYVKERYPSTEVIIMTGYGTVESAVLAMKMGAFDYISKPFKYEEILHRVRKAINNVYDKRDIDSFLNSYKREGENLPFIGKSRQVQAVVSLIKKASEVDLPVLITGETGTGKTLAAKTIHALSKRANKPFISINCAAVPENLFESELFGHIRGAFTGAYLERKGLIEEADEGSILLDEIGSMPITIQTKLLDVLQDRHIRRVGSNKSKRIDVRILAATNTDLEHAVKEGRFREDLYYRINVIRIHLPPLREHKEDIPLLAQYFLDPCKKELSRPDLKFSNGALDFLYTHDYHGNIRELQNIIWRAAALCQDSLIKKEDLALGFTVQLFNVQESQSDDYGGPKTFEEWERDLLVKTIEKHSHNLTKVCKELGIGRTTLWRKMKKYDIS